MQIAVCISNKETCALLTELMADYQKRRGVIFSCHFFHNDTELICDFAGGQYDVIFFSGTKQENFVPEICQKDSRVRLVCIANAYSLADKTMEQLWSCLPEPLGAAFLFPLLDRLCADIKESLGAGLVLKNRGGVIHLVFSRIEYVEVMGRTLFFHLNNGKVVKSPGSFSDLETKLLHLPNFIKIHRAYIVNLNYVQKLESHCVLTSMGDTLPVAKSVYSQLKKDWLCRLMYPDVPTEAKGTGEKTMRVARSVNQQEYSILLVDDEEDQRTYWSRLLIEKGCTVQTADNIESALSLTDAYSVDCVLLDVQLGAQNSFDLASSLIDKTCAPVIFLSVITDEKSQIQGFLSGGIDYITKDISPELFWAKIETRIKATQAVRAELHSGALRLDLKRRKAFCDRQELFLTLPEFDLLCAFMQNADTLYTPAQLYGMVWGKPQWDNGQAVQLHISGLCRKLDELHPQHRFIETVWGKGYRFVAER